MEPALLAGYSAENTAIIPSSVHASRPVPQVGNKPAKKSGMGSMFTSAHSP